MSRVLCMRISSIHFLQNPFLRSLSTVSTSPHPSSSVVQFLINSCGLPLQTALSTAQTLHLDEKNLERPQSVLDLFKSHGFSNTHIADLISKSPSVLNSKIEGTLKPKLQFLVEMGISGPLLPDLVASNPLILKRSLENHLKPSFEFLRCFLETTDNILLVIKRNRWFLTTHLKGTVMPNIAHLLGLGVPASHISKLITTHPRAFMRPPDQFAEAVSTVKRLGIKPELSLFIHAVRAMNGMRKSTWNARLELFKSLGWTDKDVASAFQRAPLCVLISEEKMRRSMSFFKNAMGLGPSDFSLHPKLLMYGLDKRILPRFAVFQVLDSKGLIRKDRRNRKLVVGMFTYNEQQFLDRYVRKYRAEAPELMDVYRGKIGADVFNSKVGKGGNKVS